MRQFNGAMHLGNNRGAATVFCKKCEKETKFFRGKCLECGRAFAKKIYKYKMTAAFAKTIRIRESNIRKDRAAYFARLAEESRKKFEGPK